VINFQIFHFSVYCSGRKATLWEMYERTGRIKALNSWERNSLEGLYEAEAMERSVLKREENFMRTAQGVHMRSKGHAKKLGGGVK